MTAAGTSRRTQAERRARTRDALLAAAARGISTYGYGALALERVASEAGCSRGALYHQFAGKEDLARQVVEWIEETWEAEVGGLVRAETTPLGTLLALARGHAIYCRRDVARVMTVLRVEFAGQEHPVGRAVEEIDARHLAWCTELVEAGRAEGALPAGPPARETAEVLLGVGEAVAITLAGRPPYDVQFMDRAVRGILGLPPADPDTARPGSGS